MFGVVVISQPAVLSDALKRVIKLSNIRDLSMSVVETSQFYYDVERPSRGESGQSIMPFGSVKEGIGRITSTCSADAPFGGVTLKCGVIGY